MEKRVFVAFNLLKREMIKEFREHPVTKEIMAGPRAKNTSGVLDGYGNLFSFIGFYQEDDPIEPILNLFTDKIQIQFGGYSKAGLVWNVSFPTASDVWAVTPMPWASGRSWARGIEQGISGIGFYLFTKREGRLEEASRSGTAIQLNEGGKIKRRKRPTTTRRFSRKRYIFRNTAYISSLLNKYEKKFLALNETAIST